MATKLPKMQVEALRFLQQRLDDPFFAHREGWVCPASFRMPWQSFAALYRKGLATRRFSNNYEVYEYRIKS